MNKTVRYHNLEVQYLYPFEITEWRKFKRVILETLDHNQFSDNPGRSKALIELKKSIPDSQEKIEFKKFEIEYAKRNVDNNKAFFELIEDSLHTDDGPAYELFKIRLKKLKEKHFSSADERFFNFLSSIIEKDFVKVLFDDSEKKGTRPYLLKHLPHIVITPPSSDLEIENEDAFPNIKDKLNINGDKKPVIRVQPNIKLIASGFGLVKVRCCIFTKKGLEETIDEIVFSSETKSCIDSQQIIEDKKVLCNEINKNILNAINCRSENKNLSLDKIDKDVKEYCHKHCLTDFFLKQNIHNLIDRANVLRDVISTSEAVDIQNLDRGTGWGKEPLFRWSNNGKGHKKGKLYKYFDYLVNDFITTPIRSSSKQKLVPLAKNKNLDKINNDLGSVLSHLERDSSWYAKEGIYPYILTFVSSPPRFKKPGCKHLSEIEEHFSNQLDNPDYRTKLARLLMKSPWKKMRIDVEPLKSSMQNVFYSDLLYMTVNIRSTLCFYYLPDDPVYEYGKYPELYNSIKYKRELEDTLVAQRILWYMYSTFNYQVGKEINSISRTFESLTSHIKKEEFREIVDELTEVTMGIDNRKIAIAEVMEDPLHRKGSTLFAEMLRKSSRAFRLQQLYLTLNDKLERLDMLGLHVNQTTNQLSSLVIQETTRATQLTIEILEAFIIGVYVVEVLHIAEPKWLEHLTSRPAIFLTMSIAVPLIALPLITLIRKSMSRFRGREPIWQQWVEKIGFGVGLAIISILILRTSNQLHILNKQPTFLLILALVGAPIALYVTWYKASARFHSNHHEE